MPGGCRVHPQGGETLDLHPFTSLILCFGRIGRLVYWPFRPACSLAVRSAYSLTAPVSLLLDRAGHAGNVVLDKERIHDGNGKRTDKRTGHQGTPVINVPFNQFGNYSHRNSLVL